MNEYLIYNEFSNNGRLKMLKKFKKNFTVTNTDECIILNEFTLELGYELFFLIDEDNGAPIVTAIKQLRKELTDLPVIRVIDNMKLGSNEYKVHLYENEIKNKLLQTDSAENQVTKIIQDIKTVFEQNRSYERCHSDDRCNGLPEKSLFQNCRKEI